MVESVSAVKRLPRQVAAAGLVGLGLALSGCAEMSDNMTVAFADPARYELYNCKQLESERKSLAVKEAELQGLMAKAETGVAGPVVSELAYRNEYVTLRGQSRLADEAWRKNNCRDTPASAAPAPAANARPNIKPAPSSRAGSAVY
jgi:hypothetical protein